MQLAIAWVLAKDQRIVPVVGARTRTQLAESLGALEVELSPEDLARIEEAVPAEVLTAALYARFRSRQDHTFAEKVLSAMRKGFGGHIEPGKGT